MRIKSSTRKNISAGFNLFGQQCLTASNGVVYLDKIRFSEEKSGFVCLKYITFVYPREY